MTKSIYIQLKNLKFKEGDVMKTAYKLFRYKGGRLYPLYVFANQEIHVGAYLVAEEGERTADGKVKSKLGKLAYRPGWHLTEFPLANHIGKKGSDGKLYQAPDTVWCEVEYEDAHDYNEEAQKKSKIARNQCLKTVPVGGWYWYKTNASAKVRWLISGAIVVKRILTRDEVARICREHGFEPQMHWDEYLEMQTK